jgi:hypothetical protein
MSRSSRSITCHVRALHLDRDRPAVAQRRGVHLRQRGGADRLVLEAAEQLADLEAQLGLDDAAHRRRVDFATASCMRSERGDVLGRHEVRARGQAWPIFTNVGPSFSRSAGEFLRHAFADAGDIDVGKQGIVQRDAGQDAGVAIAKEKLAMAARREGFIRSLESWRAHRAPGWRNFTGLRRDGAGAAGRAFRDRKSKPPLGASCSKEKGRARARPSAIACVTPEAGASGVAQRPSPSASPGRARST